MIGWQAVVTYLAYNWLLLVQAQGYYWSSFHDQDFHYFLLQFQDQFQDFGA